MANVTEVKLALKSGDRKKAGAILQKVLKENPSAEAWYLAAKLTSDPNQAKRHLKRALQFDPNYVKAKDMLRSLGSDTKSGMGDFVAGEIGDQIKQFTEKNALISRIPPRVRVALLAGIGLLIVAFLGIKLLGSVGGGSSEADNLPAPTETPIAVADAEQARLHFATSDLNIIAITQPGLTNDERLLVTSTFPIEIIGKYALSLNAPLFIERGAAVTLPPDDMLMTPESTLTTESVEQAPEIIEAAYTMTMYVYRNIESANLDAERLRGAFDADMNDVMTYRNVSLVLPLGLSETERSQLDAVLQSVPVG